MPEVLRYFDSVVHRPGSEDGVTWEGVYRTEAVAVYGVWVAPLLFLAWLLPCQ